MYVILWVLSEVIEKIEKRMSFLKNLGFLKFLANWEKRYLYFTAGLHKLLYKVYPQEVGAFCLQVIQGQRFLLRVIIYIKNLLTIPVQPPCLNRR